MKNFKIIVISLSILLFSAGCKKFGDANISPNATPNPSTGALLTNAESQLGGFAFQTQGGLYAQFFAETQYTDVSLYAAPVANFDGIYAGALYDLQNIININSGLNGDDAKAASQVFGAGVNQIAIARILKAYIFWTVTDRWGDVPYFEALKGLSNLTPKYDKQEDIYKDLIKELKEAKDQLDPNAAAVTGDIIYYKQGTTAGTWATAAAQWKKAANSLRMLIALRTSKVYPAAGQWAATEFASAFNDAAGYIATNADNLTVRYPGNVTAFKNPVNNVYNGRTDYAVSAFLETTLAGMGDQRAGAFGTSTIGFPYGLKRDDAVKFGNDNATYAKILQGAATAATAPVVVVSAANVLLAIAEAAQRNWITASVNTFYQAGITQSFAQFGLTVSNTYLTDAKVALVGDATDLQKIQLQQYIAYYPDGLQAWLNWRRTGVPALTPTPNAVNTCGIPRRYIYGTNEFSTNAANVQQAISSLGGNTECQRVWVDKP